VKRFVLATLSTAAIVLGLLAAGTAPAAAGRWAPADRAQITPGVQMYTKGAQCTANFVFTDAARRVYVGYAAHCAGTGEATDTDGCQSGSHPLGTKVRFARGGTLVGGGTTVGRGRLAYSSWITEHRLGTTDANTCAANDLALVRVAKGAVSKVTPTVPTWGGPTGLAAAPAQGDQVYTWGYSSLRPTDAVSAKTGLTTQRTNAGWGFEVYTVSPGVPGDSGSGFMDAGGRAVGVLSTLTLAPTVGSNGVGSLAKELAFAQRHSGIQGLRLVEGTEPFTGLAP
jgi:hypothetical protein